jgi:hypothetical protein
MPNHRRTVERRRIAGTVLAAEARRRLARRFLAPLIGAVVIAAAQMALVRASAETGKPSRATLEPTIHAPSFVRPARPSPDALIGHCLRIA